MTFIERHMNPANRGYKDPSIGHPLSPIPMLLVVSALNKGYVSNVILRDFSDLRTEPENLQKRVWKAYKKKDGEVINIFEAKDDNLTMNEIVPAEVFVQTEDGMEISLLIQTLGFQSVETRAPNEDEFNSASGDVQVYRYVLGTIPLLKKFDGIAQDVLESVIGKFRDISEDVIEGIDLFVEIASNPIDIEAGVSVEFETELQGVFKSFVRTVTMSDSPISTTVVEDFDSSSAYFNSLSIDDVIEFPASFVYGEDNIISITITSLDGRSHTDTLTVRVAYPTYLSFVGIDGTEDAEGRVIGIVKDTLSEFEVKSSVPEAGNLLLDGVVFDGIPVGDTYTVPVTSLSPYTINVDFLGASSNILTVDVKTIDIIEKGNFDFSIDIPSEIDWDSLLTFSIVESFEVSI